MKQTPVVLPKNQHNLTSLTVKKTTSWWGKQTADALLKHLTADLCAFCFNEILIAFCISVSISTHHGCRFKIVIWFFFFIVGYFPRSFFSHYLNCVRTRVVNILKLQTFFFVKKVRAKWSSCNMRRLFKSNRGDQNAGKYFLDKLKYL